MADRFEEDIGKYTYVTLPQIKDYLSISSNTQDARLSNIVSFATGVIEHYIGQEVLANDYVEIYDGGSTSVFTSRIPLSNVYQVSEFNGTDFTILADPTTIGTPVDSSTDTSSITYRNNAYNTTRVKKYGKSSLKLEANDYLSIDTVVEDMELADSDFTIEMYVKIDENTLANASIFTLTTDNSNYFDFGLANQYGLYATTNISGTATTVTGANTNVESEQYNKKRWSHVAVTRDYGNEQLYLHFNGNVIANSDFTVSNLSFTSNIHIGKTVVGHVDEIRVSNKARYSTDFKVPIHRFRTDNDTICLIHFDEGHKSTKAYDVHAASAQYSFARDTGEISRDLGGGLSYPQLDMGGISRFKSYPSGVQVSYRAGYEATDVPKDLQLATLDYIKILYKQDQGSKSFSFEGESKESFPLSSNFPPHIRKTLDLYRIIK